MKEKDRDFSRVLAERESYVLTARRSEEEEEEERRKERIFPDWTSYKYDFEKEKEEARRFPTK